MGVGELEGFLQKKGGKCFHFDLTCLANTFISQRIGLAANCVEWQWHAESSDLSNAYHYTNQTLLFFSSLAISLLQTFFSHGLFAR